MGVISNHLVWRKRTLQIAFWIMLFVGGMIAGQLLLFHDAIPTVKTAYWIEDIIFFLSVAIIAILTFHIWWPLIWQTNSEE